jgi:2-hydroxychromene-2-carboxylate isomerase
MPDHPVAGRPPLVFWYEFASTYSYVAAARVERLATAAGLAVEWRPFLLGPIFGAQGWTTSPFNIYPAKGRYMWRDMERLCEDEGLDFVRPEIFPQNGLLAARTALVGADEGWVAPFTRAVYRANFAEGADISKPETVARALARLDLDPAPILERAQSQPIKDRLKANTEAAISAGLFGAPSFTVGDELFWGNDRLEQAIAWATRG